MVVELANFLKYRPAATDIKLAHARPPLATTIAPRTALDEPTRLQLANARYKPNTRGGCPLPASCARPLQPKLPLTRTENQMAKLTEIEQQEIVRFIEAGQPLPDKYRFLLFEDKREVELVWNGKTSEVSNIVLPFQVIEQVDEPRAEQDTRLQPSLFDVDARGRQLKGWTNKLIWGDNKLILSSLKNGPLREEIEKQGGLKLIYIDPPFDVGADFSMDIEIGD